MVIAAKEKEYTAWEQTAELIAALYNCHRDPKKRRRAYTGYDIWHRPGARRPRGNALTVDALHGLKAAFTKEA